MRIGEIAGVPVGRSRPYLILEAGVNHEGSLDTAFEMIDAAADAGAQMIKFQSYKAETLASRESPAYWDRTKETADSQFALFKKHDSFGDAQYAAMAARCREKGIAFCSTPFDAHFVDFLDAYMPIYKVASADLTNLGLLRRIAEKGKPVLLSTGASHLSEIEEAVRTLREAGTTRLCLLHCVLEYPTAPAHANLQSIPYLAGVFPDVTIGWSDHVPPRHECLSLLAAWMLGADILEKHYTLDKSLPGNDHYHAMDPDDVRGFLERVASVEEMMGNRGKGVLACEGDARKYARRSLVAARDLAPGDLVGAEDLIAKRPGTGIEPRFADLLIGRRVRTPVREDQILQWEMFLD